MRFYDRPRRARHGCPSGADLYLRAVPGPRAARRLVAVAAVGALALVGFAADRTAEATGPAVVRLTDRQTSLTSVGGRSTGGREIVRLTLFGSSSTKRPIGHGVLVCTFVGGGERSCEGSYVLPRGSIETAGVLSSRLIYTHAVVGGTGLFDNARGTLTVTAKTLTPRREILLFRLTG